MNRAAVRYFDRAAWALENAINEPQPAVKSHLTAAAVHACQSLKEALDQLLQEKSGDSQLMAAIKKLPHTELIENIRSMDLHGWPLPVCDPKVRMVVMVTKPGQPVALSSSHGVGVAIQMDGLRPKVHRAPKDFKHGTVTIGGATVSYGCDQGKLIVHDFSTDKDYFLLDVLKAFLHRCYPLIKSRYSPPSASTDGATEAPQPATPP